MEEWMGKKRSKDNFRVAPPTVLEYICEVGFLSLAPGSPGKIPSEELFYLVWPEA